MITISGYTPKTLNQYDSRDNQSDLGRLLQKKDQVVFHQKTHCNLCGQSFTPQFRRQLFCKKCRSENDAFLFNEWLPRVPDGGSSTV